MFVTPTDHLNPLVIPRAAKWSRELNGTKVGGKKIDAYRRFLNELTPEQERLQVHVDLAHSRHKDLALSYDHFRIPQLPPIAMRYTDDMDVMLEIMQLRVLIEAEAGEGRDGEAVAGSPGGAPRMDWAIYQHIDRYPILISVPIPPAPEIRVYATQGSLARLDAMVCDHGKIPEERPIEVVEEGTGEATMDDDDDKGDFAIVYKASDGGDAADPTADMEVNPFTGAPIPPIAPNPPALVAPIAPPLLLILVLMLGLLPHLLHIVSSVHLLFCV
ncbi:hypothetical protein U1Q18_002348 [Sarracenia purpurea var. burkii]